MDNMLVVFLCKLGPFYRFPCHTLAYTIVEAKGREQEREGGLILTSAMLTDIAMQFSALNVNIFQYQDEVMVEVCNYFHVSCVRLCLLESRSSFMKKKNTPQIY